MAKSSRPLRILVHPDLIKLPSIEGLKQKGNVVQSMDATTAASTFELILGPNCWRIPPGMESLVESAVKAARRVKYKTGDDDGTKVEEE